MTRYQRGRGHSALGRVASYPLAAIGVLALACGGAAPDDPEELVTAPGAPPSEEAREGHLRVWLDVDPAIGLPRGEVDDGLFMLQSFHSPEFEISGVSVVFGNAPLAEGLPIARALTARFGPADLAVHEGASSAEQLGERTPAVDALAAALREAPLHLLAVGPVTNVGTLLQLHPELHERIEQIVVVAGRRVGQQFRTGTRDVPPFRDFNFELDAPAMQVILDSKVPLVMAPWEVSSHVWLRRADLDDLAGRSEAGAWAAGAVQSWIQRWSDDLGVDGFNPFDTLAAGWLTHPELYESFVGGVWIEAAMDDTQDEADVIKPYLYADPQRREGRQARYLYRPDDAFQALLKDRIAGAAVSEAETQQ